MKKLVFVFILSLAGISVYAGENTISLGFQAPITFMFGSSNQIISNNIDVTKLYSIEYGKILYSTGANIKGKFSGDGGWGGMFKVNCFFPYLIISDTNVSGPLLFRDASSKIGYTEFDPAFIVGAGGGILKRFYINDMFHISLDLGPEFEFDVVDVDTFRYLIITVGIFSELSFEFHVSKHLFFDIGLNYDLLLGGGVYGYKNASIIVNTGEFGFSVSPSISIGYKF